MSRTFKKGDYVNVNCDLGYFWAKVTSDVDAKQELVPVRIDVSEANVHNILNSAFLFLKIHKDYVHDLREYVETKCKDFNLNPADISDTEIEEIQNKIKQNCVRKETPLEVARDIVFDAVYDFLFDKRADMEKETHDF